MGNLQTTRQVVADLGTTYWRVYHAIRDGHIKPPATKAGTMFLWTVDEVTAARKYFANVKGAK